MATKRLPNSFKTVTGFLRHQRWLRMTTIRLCYKKIDKMYEKTIDQRVLHQGKFLSFVEHDIEIEGSNPIKAKRQFILHPGGVCAVPVLDQDKIVLVNQFRKPIEQELLEIPAGKIDPGETDTLLTAQRELQEETGYTAKTWHKLGEIIPCPGYSNEILHLYLARDLIPGKQNLDYGEVVETHTLSLKEACQKIYSGEIQDSKTINGIFLAMNFLNLN